ncbi:amidohydrolase family protein [Dactylosporangium sp. NPDC000521]|uniref:amidohydrolase family protein n=1 Tax=Dactylosporangium sp. NPDC000521 TaxID=3363975 RepID=UPI0036AA740C
MRPTSVPTRTGTSGLRSVVRTTDRRRRLTRYLPHQAPPRLLADPAFRTGFRHLAQRGLSFDAALFHHQLPDLADLADAFPNASIVLNHCGLPATLDAAAAGSAAVFNDWRQALREVARRPNIICKISGFGLPFYGFGFDTRTDTVGHRELAAAWTPYVETAIEVFGAGRCMMASDYPADSQSSGFVPLWNALKFIVRSATAEEKAALFHDTAQRVYRIGKTRQH